MSEKTQCDKCGKDTYIEIIYEDRFCSYPAPIQLCNLCRAETYINSEEFEPPPEFIVRDDIPF